MCEYCNGSFDQKPVIDNDRVRVYVDAKYPLAEINANCITSYEDMNFCPMCGRDLRGRNNG